MFSRTLPPHSAPHRKSPRLTETFFPFFLFWLKGLWEVCFIRRSFCVFVVFSFLCFRKSARPPFDKATEGILFLVSHLLLTLSRNRPRCAVFDCALVVSGRESCCSVLQAKHFAAIPCSRLTLIAGCVRACVRLTLPPCLWRSFTFKSYVEKKKTKKKPKLFCLFTVAAFNTHPPYLSPTPLLYFHPPVDRWAGRGDHVPSLPPRPPHDRQGNRLLERRRRHGLLHLRLVAGRPAARPVQVNFLLAPSFVLRLRLWFIFYCTVFVIDAAIYVPDKDLYEDAMAFGFRNAADE